nr:EamA family transporter RarD [uncultured Gellertiella sp.]
MTDETVAIAPKNEDSMRGFAFALGAYLLWGFLPFYMKALAHISPAEVIAHRILWSLPVAGAVLYVQNRTADLKAALGSRRTLLLACMTATLITVNWGLYVWAIGAGRALDTALGYYINPLFSVLLGALLLKEKLHLAQKVAIALAFAAVAVLTIEAGGLPWVSLGLTVSWGFYALFRKTLPVGPNQGFFLEVMILALPALGYVIYLQSTGQGHFLTGPSPVADTSMLAGCGLVTAVPLMLYANGAKLLKLSTIGIMQYIAPTMIFLSAVFIFGEPFGKAQMIAFPLIWLALIVYTSALVQQARARNR